MVFELSSFELQLFSSKLTLKKSIIPMETHYSAGNFCFNRGLISCHTEAFVGAEVACTVIQRYFTEEHFSCLMSFE